MIQEKDNLNTLKPYEPGKPIEEVKRELGLEHIIKLASNENPFGPAPAAVAALRKYADKVHIYPDGYGYELKKKLSDKLGVSMDTLVLGNGSNELIELLIKAYMYEGDELIATQPSFLVYPLAAQSANVKCVNVPLTEDLRHNLNAMLAKITDRTKLIFICNPNNPTGTLMTAAEIEDFMTKVPDSVITVFDEAYYEFAALSKDYPNTLKYLNGDKQVAILRTFSKSYGLAGLRIGFGIMPPAVAAALNKTRQPFNTNVMAQVAATAALDDDAFLKKTLDNNVESYKFITAELQKMGLKYVDSYANFLLIDTEQSADEVFQKMMKKGVIIRSMSAYGLTNYIRVTFGTPAENEMFLRVLKEVL